MPDQDARTTLRVLPSSMQNPLKKLTCVRFVPTVLITLVPHKLRPCRQQGSGNADHRWSATQTVSAHRMLQQHMAAGKALSRHSES